MATKRFFIAGLDCATPQLIFDEFRDDLKNLSSLMKTGVYGRLRSTIPPITVPAWTTMFSGKDPGELGVYGFRNRKDHSYDALFFANSTAVKVPRVWDILTQRGISSITIGIPQTYPPKPVHGIQVGCFLTPTTDSDYTYPKEIKQELDRIANGYIIDVEEFRTDDKDILLSRIFEMTDKRFRVVKQFLKEKEWTLFAFVEMGIDRIHHGFWKFCDPTHPKFVPNNKYRNSIRDYYKFVDEKIGEVIPLLPRDTVTLVVSDHGAKKMVGGICINEFLMKMGYLTLKETPREVTRLDYRMIDWKRTKAWGEGGYYSRIFFNVKGREPLGVIHPSEYENFRTEIISILESMTDENGNLIGTRAFRPEDIYREVNGIPPDLIVYLGNLDWRAVGSVGFGRIHVFENDTGPDDANHSEHGIFILNDPDGRVHGRYIDEFPISGIKNLILSMMGIETPDYARYPQIMELIR